MVLLYYSRGLYGWCPQWSLNWEYRKKMILDEIKHFSADIIALQVSLMYLIIFNYENYFSKLIMFKDCNVFIMHRILKIQPFSCLKYVRPRLSIFL